MATQEKAERSKAQQLRKTPWWHNQIQNALCYYCQIPLTSKDATMDHIVPINQGGKSTKGNVVVCCKPCNTKKSSRNAVEWILQLQSETN